MEVPTTTKITSQSILSEVEDVIAMFWKKQQMEYTAKLCTLYLVACPVLALNSLKNLAGLGLAVAIS